MVLTYSGRGDVIRLVVGTGGEREDEGMERDGEVRELDEAVGAEVADGENADAGEAVDR